MSKILILTKDVHDVPPNHVIVGLDWSHCNKVDINCFKPTGNAVIPPPPQNVCFVPFSKEHDWNYKQQARAARYSIGNDQCRVVETDFTYKIHRKIGLPYHEEVDTLLLAIEYFLTEVDQITISNRVDLSSDKESRYLEKLIEEEKVKVLYGE